MSRSYKKAIIKDHGKSTYIDKRMASKAVRRCKNVGNGGAYKKVFCSYDICDYVFDMRFGNGKFLHRGARWTDAGWIIPK